MRLKSLTLIIAAAASVSSAFAGPINYLYSELYFSEYANTSGAGSASWSDYSVTDGAWASTTSNSGGEFAQAYAQGYASYSTDAVYSSGYVQAYAAVGTTFGAAEASVYSYYVTYFQLTSASNVYAELGSSAYAQEYAHNEAAVGDDYDGWSGLYDFSTNSYLGINNLDGVYSGSGVLAAGYYAFVNVNQATAVAYTGNGDGYAYAQVGSYGYLTAEAVPEPASMAVLAVGALALLRRRKKA